MYLFVEGSSGGAGGTIAARRPVVALAPLWIAVTVALPLVGALPLAAASPQLDVAGMTFVASRGPSNELILDAAHARFDIDTDRVHLQEVHAVVEPGSDAGHFEIYCDEGELDLTTNDFEARGNVRGQTKGERTFRAPWVKYDHEKGLLYTDAPVLISEDLITYRGGGFRYFVREGRFKLLGGASVLQQPEELQ